MKNDTRDLDRSGNFRKVALLAVLTFLAVIMLGGGVFGGLVTAVSVVAIVIHYCDKPSPNIFKGSGNSPPATHAQELILRRKGGKGSSYFSDPSLAFGELSNFRYTVGRTVNFKELLEEKWDVLGPYCVDDERRQVVLVEVEPGFDPASVGPFYFQSQRDNAIRVYTVPYEEYYKTIEELPLTHTNNVLLVYNTARCGSTLLSHILDGVNGMQSISEPDALTSITHIASEATHHYDEELTKLATASIKLLCHLRRRMHPDRDGVCIKFRFQQIYVADLMAKAAPDAKSIFLYRNGLDVVDSMGAAFINTGAYRAIRAVGLDILYVFYLSTLPQHLWKLMPLIKDDKRFPLSCYKWLGAVTPFVFSWLSVMTYAMEAEKCGLLKACIRYEDMIKGKEAYVIKMLKACGLDVPESSTEQPRLTSRFTSDAHGDSITASKRSTYDEEGGVVKVKGYAYLRQHEVALAKSIIARHGSLHANFIIPGTLRA